MTILGIFNQLLSTQNVNVANFTPKVDWDFISDIQKFLHSKSPDYDKFGEFHEKQFFPDDFLPLYNFWTLLLSLEKSSLRFLAYFCKRVEEEVNPKIAKMIPHWKAQEGGKWKGATRVWHR